MEKTPKKRTKAKKTGQGHSITECYKILEGAAQVIRTTKSGNFWSLSCWIREEGKCYRRSLHTRNLEDAKKLAQDEYFKLRYEINSGNKIFSKTARELVEEYIKHREEEANGGFISQGRVSTIRTSLNRWFLRYVGESKKLSKITRHDFSSYYIWRRQKASTVINETLQNERALITSLFKFGIQKGYLKHEQSPNFPVLRITKATLSRRDELDLKEWEAMFRSFRRWVSNSSSDKEKEQRQFIKDFIIIAANTGLRFGEMRKLKWHMIKTYTVSQLNERKEKQTHVEIKVPIDTKTGARTATGRRGDVFDRIKKLSKHSRPNDWIFVDNDTGEQIHKKVYYKQWPTLLVECGLNKSNKKLTYYSLRHTYITFRLLAGTNAFLLSQNAGTSLKTIEAHYAHIKSDIIKRELTKDMNMDEAGQILLG